MSNESTGADVLACRGSPPLVKDDPRLNPFIIVLVVFIFLSLIASAFSFLAFLVSVFSEKCCDKREEEKKEEKIEKEYTSPVAESPTSPLIA